MKIQSSFISGTDFQKQPVLMQNTFFSCFSVYEPQKKY